jgi:putative transposase
VALAEALCGIPSTWYSDTAETNTGFTRLCITSFGRPNGERPSLVGGVAADCQKLIERKCAEQGWEILKLAVQPDPIHLFVQAWPTVSAAEIVKECKGLTSHDLRQEYPVLKRLPSLWTRSYFAATAGTVSAAAIQRYLAAQKGL